MSSPIVRAIQTLSNAMDPTNQIRVDGILGGETLSAIRRDTLLSQLAERVQLGGSRPTNMANRVFVPKEAIEKAIEKAVSMFGPDVRPFLEFMVRVENYPDTVGRAGIFTTFGGTFQGVAQFSSETWRLGSAKFPQVGNYQNVTDTEKSILLAAWYWNDHKAIFRAHAQKLRIKANYDPVVAYLYHQQGASAALKFLQTGQLQYPRQSRITVAAFQEVRSTLSTVG